MSKVQTQHESRLLLCTDMDRTVIPNGAQSESAQARKCFTAFCNLPQVSLVYVTGRHQALVKDAIEEYRLPIPQYAITDVGTIIYHVKNGEWLELHAWGEEIARAWNGKGHAELKHLFDDIAELRLQEPEKQNIHKLSYYVPLSVRQEELIAQMAQRLAAINVQASLVWSVDEPAGIGLLDVLPGNASKRHAVDFLQLQLGFAADEVLFAGDSGNDLAVLASAIPSVLVANASPEVRDSARQMAQDNGNASALYLASGDDTNMNGNYSAGILEGVWHFVPALRESLQQLGFVVQNK